MRPTSANGEVARPARKARCRSNGAFHADPRLACSAIWICVVCVIAPPVAESTELLRPLPAIDGGSVLLRPLPATDVDSALPRPLPPIDEGTLIPDPGVPEGRSPNMVVPLPWVPRQPNAEQVPDAVPANPDGNLWHIGEGTTPGVAEEPPASEIERLPAPTPSTLPPPQESNRPDVVVDKPFAELTTNILANGGRLPVDYAGKEFDREGVVWHVPGLGRPWMDSEVYWEAPALCHRPLYFQEINLERHGHKARVVQPLVSAASFYGRIPALPYLIALDPPHRPVYTLGYRRPGSHVACRMTQVPLLLGPGAVQAAVIMGLIIAIP